MAKENILVVEDDQDIQELVRYNLAKESYKVSCLGSGEGGIKAAKTLMPDLIILDLMLPGVDGLEVCRVLKQDPKTQGIPIVMLTAKGEEADIVAGLELGADDYITKPFSPRVLLARIKTVLRRRKRSQPADDSPIKIGDLLIDPGRHEVLIRGKPVDLTFTEFKVLQLLAGKPGWVYSRSQIVDAVRGEDYAVTERAVDVQIVGLRKKIGSLADCVETVRGVGYRFRE